MRSGDLDQVGCALVVQAVIVVIAVAVGILVGYMIWGGA